MDIPAYGQQPGMGTLIETGQTAVITGRESRVERGTVVISSAAVDAGASPTTKLRSGLILGKITASGLYKQYDPAATDGSEVALLVLAEEMSTLDSAGAVANKEGHVFLVAVLQSANIIGISAVSRRQLLASGRYLFDDDLGALYGAQGFMQREIDKAANYTVVAADVGTLFTASAAAVFTLPALAAGLGPFEFLNLANAAMGVASAEGDNMVWVNDVSVDSLTASTASQMIGARLRVRANSAGTKWLVENLSPPTTTWTAVT